MVINETLPISENNQCIQTIDLPEEELRWCIINLKEVLEKGKRLEASVFDIEGKHSREVLKSSKWNLIKLTGNNGITEAYSLGRFKRIWLDKSDFPIYQPSQIMEIKPYPNGFLSKLTRINIESLRVKRNQVLLTCSGTIGNCSYVSETLNNKIFSHDLIRINCKKEKDAGYVYAFLKTKIGNIIIQTNEYGAVVSHIEPEHLENIPIPNPPDPLKEKIHNLIIRSYELRDESNFLLDQAEELLYDALKLPPIEKLKPRYFDPNADLRNYSMKLSKLAGRFDASYHVPIVDEILRHLRKEASELTTIGDTRISQDIILPGRFARVYVEEGQGTVFLGGKQLYELDPSNKKYLSSSRHGGRIKSDLFLKENMILITRSGTIGKVMIVPKHWGKWVANEHIIRVVPASDDIAGYLYVFLSTEYGRELITRFTYGSVVDEIDDNHVSRIHVPLLKDSDIQYKINRLSLEANEKRTEAYHAEQDAISIINDEVIYSKK